MIRTLIIDDEEKSRKITTGIISRNCPEVSIIGEADGVKTGIDAILGLKPELVLLDIEINGGTGFDILKQLPQVDFKIIFITAFQEFAVEAFQFSAIDYLLKPLNPERLKEVIEKVSDAIEKENLQTRLQTLISNISQTDKKPKKLVLKTADKITVAEIDDIIRCESEGNYTTFFLKDKTRFMVSKLIKDYEELLSKHGFFRSHQSHLFNLDFFKEYRKKDDTILLKDNSEIPLASRKKENFLQMLEQL